MHLAAQSDRTDILEHLLTKDPDGVLRKSLTDEGRSLLMCASCSSIAMIKLVIRSSYLTEVDAGEKGMAVTAGTDLTGDATDILPDTIGGEIINQKTTKGSTALHFASSYSDADTIRFLLSQGADIKLTTDKGKTPLHLAVSHKPENLIAFTTAAGVEQIVNQKDDSGFAPIHHLVLQGPDSGNVGTLKTLLQIPGVDLNQTNKDDHTPLMQMTFELYDYTHEKDQRNTFAIIKTLLKENVDLNKTDKYGSTLLHLLCSDIPTPHAASTIEILLDKKIDVFVRNKDGLLAVEVLLLAFKRPHPEGLPIESFESNILKPLLDCLTDEQFNNLNRGCTPPLVHALHFKAYSMVENFAKRSVAQQSPNTENATKISPLEATCIYPCPIGIFELLASRCEDLSRKNDRGQTLLHLTCIHNRRDIFDILMARKVDLDSEDVNGMTPLYLAMTYDCPILMDTLLDAGANCTHLQRDGVNLWHSAASATSKDVLDKLLRKNTPEALESRASNGFTPLLYAVQFGGQDNIETLLAQGANTNVRDHRGNGVLHIASARGRAAILKYLLEKDDTLDVNATNNAGDTPLIISGHCGHQDCLSVLLDLGADPTFKNKKELTLLHSVALEGRLDIFLFLKHREIRLDLEACDDGDATPLLCAAARGHALIVQELLDQGADTRAVDWQGLSALDLAVVYGRNNVVSLLLQGYDNLFSYPGMGKTEVPLLNTAASNGHMEVFRTLMSKGADIRATDDKGWTVVHAAALYSKQSILEEIFRHCTENTIELDINAKDKESRTPLMLVEEEQDVEATPTKAIMELLKEHGATKPTELPDDAQIRKMRRQWEGYGGLCNIDVDRP